MLANTVNIRRGDRIVRRRQESPTPHFPGTPQVVHHISDQRQRFGHVPLQSTFIPSGHIYSRDSELSNQLSGNGILLRDRSHPTRWNCSRFLRHLRLLDVRQTPKTSPSTRQRMASHQPNLRPTRRQSSSPSATVGERIWRDIPHDVGCDNLYLAEFEESK